MAHTIHASVGNGTYSEAELAAARIVAAAVDPNYPGAIPDRSADLGFYNSLVDQILDPYQDVELNTMIAAKRGEAYSPAKAAQTAWASLREYTGAATPYARLGPLVDALISKTQPELPQDVARMPVYDKAGYVYCPTHRTKRLIRTKSGDAWRCPEYGCYYWPGNGYAEPAAQSAPAVVESSEPKPPTYIHSDQLSTIPKPTYLIDGLIVERGLNVLYGASGCGKSFKVIDWCAALAQTHRVMYVAAEDAGGYTARIEAWKEHNQLGTPGLLFWPMEINTLIAAEVDSFVDEIAPLSLSLVVLDTLQACISGGDDSNGTDMGMFLSACNKIRRATGAAVLAVHHTGKNGEYRGHSSLLGAADMFLRMEDRDGLKLLSWDKVKNGQKPANPMMYRFEQVGETGSGVLIYDDQARPEKKNGLTQNQYKVLEALSMTYFEETGTSATNLCDITSITRSSIYHVLSTLSKKGMIQRGARGDNCKITYEGKQAFKAAYYANHTRDVQFDGSLPSEKIQLVQPLSKSESNSIPSTETLSYSKSNIAAPLEGRNILGQVGLSNQEAIQEVGQVEVIPSQELDKLELPATPNYMQLDWAYCLKVYALNDLAALKRHCIINRANYDDVLAELTSPSKDDEDA